MSKLETFEQDNGAWRSLVAHLLWEQGVGGSNPLAPTIKKIFRFMVALYVLKGSSETLSTCMHNMLVLLMHVLRRSLPATNAPQVNCHFVLDKD